MLPYGCGTSQPEEEKLPEDGCNVQKPVRSHPAPEENGDIGSVDPAAPELIHQRQFPALQTTPVMVPPCPSFSDFITSISWASQEYPRKGHSQSSDN